MTDKAVYFMKFNASDSHLDELVANGDLYMNCPQYYVFKKEHTHDPEIGDEYEGALLGIMRKYSKNLMFCLYSVFPNDITNINGCEAIKIQSKVIETLAAERRSFAVIDVDSFCNRLMTMNKVLTFGQVEYLYPSTELDYANLLDDTGKALLVKRPRFSYQQEARLILKEEFSGTFYVKGSEDNEEDRVLMIDGKEYHGTVRSVGSMASFACVLSVDDLVKQDGAYYLPKEKICFEG